MKIDFLAEMAREFIVEGFNSDPTIQEVHTVMEGIKGRTQLAMLNKFGLTMQTDAGCGEPVNTGTLIPFQKYLNPVDVAITLRQCYTDIKQSFMVWQGRSGVQKYNLDLNTAWSQFWAELVLESAREEVLRKVWFDDTTIAAGDLTGGAGQVPYFNSIDGLWKKIFAGVTSGDIIKANYTITENAAANIAAQMNLGANVAKDVFTALFRDSDARLTGRADSFIVATDSLVRNYIIYLISQGNDNSWTTLQSGIRVPSFNGYPVISMNIWDRTIQTYFKTGTPETYDLPHRALLVTRDSFAVAVDSLSDFGTFEPYFNPETLNMTTRVMGKLDAEYTWGYTITAAY